MKLSGNRKGGRISQQSGSGLHPQRMSTMEGLPLLKGAPRSRHLHPQALNCMSQNSQDHPSPVFLALLVP